MIAAALPEYLQIENNPGLARHTHSMGVINTDKQSKTRYIIQRDRILKDKSLLTQAINEVSNLKRDLNDLREIVQHYINPPNSTI